MKVLVYPHDLAIGGSQINAVDLAAEVARRGHEVSVYGVPGPLVGYITEKGLRFLPAHPMRYRPAPTRMYELARLVRREGVDLIHAYEWPPCLDAYYGAHLPTRVPLVCTVLSMDLDPVIPGSIPLIMGTRELQESSQQTRSGSVGLIEPPIDTESDHPGVDGSAFRRRYDPTGDQLLVVIVSRLSVDLKLDALVRATDAVGELAQRLPVRLVLVGTGDAATQLQRRAEQLNTSVGREVVTLAGATLDPRPAYAGADLVLGMGSSALRAMAIGRPVIVQGEDGFSLVCEPAAMGTFAWQGFYGHGTGSPCNDLLVGQVARLLTDGDRRRDLGRFGRRTVENQYSLLRATDALLEHYEDARRPRIRRHLLEASRVAGRACLNELRLHFPNGKRARRDLHEGKLAAAANASAVPTVVVPTPDLARRAEG